jgi:hypothetical protein
MSDAKRLFECEPGQRPGRSEDADWALFNRAARAAGYASGLSCANDLDLWDRTVADAIRFCEEQEVSDVD